MFQAPIITINQGRGKRGQINKSHMNLYLNNRKAVQLRLKLPIRPKLSQFQNIRFLLANCDRQVVISQQPIKRDI